MEVTEMAKLTQAVERKAFSAAIDVALSILIKTAKKDCFRSLIWHRNLWVTTFRLLHTTAQER